MAKSSSLLLLLVAALLVFSVVFGDQDESSAVASEEEEENDGQGAVVDDVVVATAVLRVGTIKGKLQFPDRTPFNTTTRIALNHGEVSTYSRGDGRFTMHNVNPGIHVLDVLSTTHHFSQIKIQLLEEDMDHPNCIEYAYPGAARQPIAHPLVLNAIATYDYFEVKRGFSILSLFKNPMILMMAFSVGMMFLMPKMMEGLDPEEKERMKKQMEMQKDPTKMLGELWSGLTAPEEEHQQQQHSPSKSRKARK